MKQSPRFIVDKITNSIEERITGKRVSTEIVVVTKEEINKVHKKDGWFFNWKTEFKIEDHEVYKLEVEGDTKIQGLISIKPLIDDMYVEVPLIEIAPHNFGDNRKYLGVAGNMVAFACRTSFELGMDGFIAFDAKTKLIEHYEKTLGARLLFRPSRMGIFTEEAKNLVNSYYKDFFNEEE